MTTTNNKMEHVLYIPDYVIPGDEDTIIQFFHNFEIAKVEKVEIYEGEPGRHKENNKPTSATAQGKSITTKKKILKDAQAVEN